MYVPLSVLALPLLFTDDLGQVLCAYLGQLAKLRDALAKEVAVLIDDRDQAELAEQDEEKEDVMAPQPSVERVAVSRRVCWSFN